MYKKVLIVLSVAFSTACVPRQALSAKYGIIEEFKVGDMTVKAFAYPEEKDAGWGNLYDFAVYRDGVKVRDIVVQWHDLFGRAYFLEETFSQKHVTYELYYEPPPYKELKKKVIEILR